MSIKFNKHNVTDGVYKARVWYAAHETNDGKKCVALSAKDYGWDLPKIFPVEYINYSDSREDYFETGKVMLLEGHPLYSEALAKVQSNRIFY